MNQEHIDAMIEKILKKVIEEGLPAENKAEEKISDNRECQMPGAYVILPQQISGKTVSDTIDVIGTCRENYRIFLAAAGGRNNIDEALIKAADQIIDIEEVEPHKQDILVVMAASSNLRVKTALCLWDDCESRVIVNSIGRGIPVYMYRKDEYLTEGEPIAFRKKLEAYDRELKTFGVQFDCCPLVDDMRLNISKTSTAVKKKDIITTAEVKKILDGRLILNPGDIVTDAAKELLQEKGIEIIYK